MIICELAHCDNDAEFLDELGNYMCSDCVEMEIAEGGATIENFEAIDNG